MAFSYDGGWPRYVSVAERREKAAREVRKLRKKGRSVDPVMIEARAIAKTFWGKAWCDNLESYRDYENRLSRGRSYVRHGSVIDLQISALEIKAMVSGSSIYEVTVTIKALAPAIWRSICEDCTGGIDSLVELLQGRFSKGVMERLCRQDRGLFPKPSEIRFACSCPDGASMCKHVAAVLYGVGARLDGTPEHLFRLRAVDENDLVTDIDDALPFSKQPLDVGNVLETDDISSLFGLDMEAGAAVASNGATPSESKPVVRTKRKRPDKNVVRHKTIVTPCPGATDQEAKTGTKKLSGGSNTRPGKRASKPHDARKTTKAASSDGLDEHISAPNGLKSGTASKKKTDDRKPKALPPGIKLTPDGFVKWWR
ncbi:MAG: hypothetical protein ACR2RF_33345 [Geminicoccaceae bacterium]